MIGNADIQRLEQEIGPELTALLRGIESLEDWASDNTPPASQAIERLADLLHRNSGTRKLAGGDVERQLEAGSGMSFTRAMLWLSAQLSEGVEVERLLEPKGDDVNRYTLLSRLATLGRYELLTEVLGPERREQLRLALIKQKEGRS